MKEYIVLVPNNIKNKIIELSRIKYYNYNIKFMSIDTFIKRVTFDFDEKTIYNLMKKYNYNYSTSLVYLDNLYYIVISYLYMIIYLKNMLKIKKYIYMVMTILINIIKVF